MNCHRPLKHCEISFRMPLEAWMSVCVYSVFVLSCVQVAALRRVDPQSKVSHRLCKNIKKLKRRPRSNIGLQSHRSIQFGFLGVPVNEVPLHCIQCTYTYILRDLNFYRKYNLILIEVLCRIHCVTLNKLNSFIQQSCFLFDVVVLSCHT
jgi:hypothetical protein